MKRLILAAIIGSVLISCEKKDERPAVPESYETMQHPVWTAEAFKNKYTIQFPAGYKGAMVGFEGNILNKVNPTHSTSIGYNYCNNLHCSDFRDTLLNPALPSIIAILGYGQTPVLLAHKVEFTKANGLTGVLYHNNEATLRGVLFWKDEGYFKEAATVICLSQDLPEVITVLRTIKEK
jgi:hypothetical protein